MAMRTLCAAAVLLACVGIARAQDNPGQAARVREAVDRSLPFLEREGVAWMTAKDCASCHHVPFLLWSHNEARARGVVVDEKKLSDWTDWTVTYTRSRRA